MATYPLKQVEHEGLIAPPPQVRLGDDGKVSVASIVSLNQTLASIIRHINSGLSVGAAGAGTQVGNFRNQWLVFLSPGTANVEFELPHGLGRAPIGFTTWFVDAAAVIYASRYGSWNKERILLKVNVASVNCVIELA